MMVSAGRKASVRDQTMKTKRPTHRRVFANAKDEIGYLYDKLLYWLYDRGDANKARPYAKRLERLLPQVDPDNEGIFGKECWSLIHEAQGDLAGAIKHRENEIRLIRRLHEMNRKGLVSSATLKGYGYDDLSDRLDLLAILYHNSGNLEKAIEILRESKKICQRHAAKFDGAELLRDYQQEKGFGGNHR
jgi:tetratricopeptide (TPR) repeat protein